MAQVSYGTITITDTTDIEDVFLIYKGSSSNTTAPSIVWSNNTNDWITDISQITEDYIWAITVFKRTGITITQNNYTDYYSDPVCITGEPGVSISIISIKYSTLSTQNQPADNTFTLTSPPDIPEGNWLWSRTLFSNGQSVYSKAKQGKSPTISKTGNTVTITDADGNIVTITDGANGQSYYTHIRYATDSVGSNMSSSPTGKTYIGVYSGTASSAPDTANSYTWSKYVGDSGGQGVSVEEVRELYYLTTGNAPNKPTSSTNIYSDDRVGAWTSTVPSYVRNGKYYISLETSLDNNTKVFGDVTLDQATTNANANALSALDRTTAKYGSSSTGANTAAKTASCSNFVLFEGAEVFIKFTNKNTVANPTLNVNSTDAKPIKDSDGNDLAEQFYWKDKALVHFVYDGANWRILDIVTTEKYNNLVSDINGVSSTVGQHTEQISGLGTRVSTNESNITQNATNIALKVSETDFTGNNIVSKINLNSTTATISAERVEIEGAAIFTSGRLSTTNLNDTIDGRIPEIPDDLSDLSDSTGIIPDVSKTFVSATTLYYASNSTTAPSKPTSHISTNSTSTRGQWNIALPTYNASYPYLYICTEYKTKDNTYSWTSVEQTSYSNAISAIKTNADEAIKSQVNLYYASNSTTPPNKPTAHVLTNNSSSYGVWNIALPTYSDTYPYLYTCKETLTNDGTYAWTSVEQSTYVAATAAIKNVADAAAPKSSAIAEEQRIYYRSKTNSKPSGNGLPPNNTWVTNNVNIWNENNTTSTVQTGTVTGWTRKITPMGKNGVSSTTAQKYLYLWTCIQRKAVDGTITYGDILLDDSTTIIDGGTIVTGSITANEITGSTLSAIYADMGSITAGNITKGYNSINFDNSPATLEFKNASTWSAATQGIKYDTNGLAIKGAITATSLTISGTDYANAITTIPNKANSADSNWSISIATSGTPDYTTPSVTLVATIYHNGAIATSGFSTPQWYKNGSTTVLSGATYANGKSTITVTDVDAYYTCTISSN